MATKNSPSSEMPPANAPEPKHGTRFVEKMFSGFGHETVPRPDDPAAGSGRTLPCVASIDRAVRSELSPAEPTRDRASARTLARHRSDDRPDSGERRDHSSFCEPR